GHRASLLRGARLPGGLPHSRDDHRAERRPAGVVVQQHDAEQRQDVGGAGARRGHALAPDPPARARRERADGPAALPGPPRRALLHVGTEPRADCDRAPGARRRELHEAHLVAHLMVVVGVEPNLVDVERLRAVDVRHRHLHELESPVHSAAEPIVSGMRVVLRPLAPDDADELLRIHRTPEVVRWWDVPCEGFPWDEPESTRFTIEVDGGVAGMIQYSEETEPKYRHAAIDVFVDPELH